MNSQTYEYTLYSEPDHSVLLDHVSGKECAAYMQETEGMLGYCCWKYLRLKLLAGEEEGYLLKMHAHDPNQDGRSVFKTRPERGADSEVERIPPMCGYCSKWIRANQARENGLRMGTCGATGKMTERCHWCDARKGVE